MPMRGDRGDTKRIGDEAAAWHARMLEPTSADEVAAFEAWLDEAPEHARAYHEVQCVSSLGANLPNRLLHDQPAASTWRLRPAFGLAAAIVLVVLAGVWLVAPGAQPAYAAISNPGPAIRAVRLTDGSKIILDAQTELAVGLESDAREVRIASGRARFTVAPGDERPFSVSTPAGTVTARGTVFDVALVEEVTKVFVIEGIVDLADHEQAQHSDKMAVRSGQAVELRDGRVRPTAINQLEARWPAGRLPFDEATLASVVQMANREGDPDIMLESDAVASLKVTGVFDIRDTRELARKLAATHDLRAQEDGGSIIIAP